MKKFFILLMILTTIVIVNTQNCVYSQDVVTVNTNTLKTRTVNVPAGITFRAVTTTPIDSAVATNGQSVTMVLNSDLNYSSRLIAPKGSSVVGSIIDVSSAKHGNINAKLLMRFTQIITPGGTNIPISAIVKTEDNSGVLIGGVDEDTLNTATEKLNYSANLNTPMAISAMGRDSSVIRDVGNGGGLLKSIWDKGAELTIPVNTSVELLLLQPITVNLGNTELEVIE